MEDSRILFSDGSFKTISGVYVVGKLVFKDVCWCCKRNHNLGECFPELDTLSMCEDCWAERVINMDGRGCYCCVRKHSPSDFFPADLNRINLCNKCDEEEHYIELSDDDEDLYV